MTREEHTAKIRAIQEKIKDVDDGSITEMLADISDDYGTMLGRIDTLDLENTKYKNDNESLRDTNMRLFLKVGDDMIQNKNTNSQDSGTSNDEPKISFEDLFDERGELR